MFWDDDFWNLDPEDFVVIGATIGLLEEQDEDEMLTQETDEDAENEPTS